ncbi:MAG: BMP family protein [Myxococcota bacterium]
MHSGHTLHLVAWLLFALAPGCRNTSSDAPAPEQVALRVALLLPDTPDDHGWSQAGYQGLKRIERELGAEVVYTPSVTADAAEPIIRDYARAGFDFVVGHGGEYIPSMEKVAPEFPQARFAVVGSYPGNNFNLGALSFRDGELGYLCGAVAALRSASGKVAFIGGVPYPHMKEQAVLFERGAKATKPSVSVEVHWLGSWYDEGKAASIARMLIRRGFDVLLADADAAGVGVFREAKAAGVHAIGWAVDQNHLAPESVVTSGIQRVDVLLLNGARLVEQGRWEGKQYKFGLREGAQSLAPFRGLLSDDDAATVQRVEADILAGRVEVTP